MKVLMLGWEYPPHISGGLGTACQGMSTALARKGVEIDFIVPRLFGNEQAPHMNLLDSYKARAEGEKELDKEEAGTKTAEGKAKARKGAIATVQVPTLLTPYANPASYAALLERIGKQRGEGGQYIPAEIEALIEDIIQGSSGPSHGSGHYGPDLFAEVDRFTKNVIAAARTRTFDVIHAHDWMTYPAGVALSRLTGVPLITHVHSLEFDRSGQNVNERIHRIESAGLHAANAVIAVSFYTRMMIHKHHGIPLEKVHVVHNGVYSREAVQSYETEKPKQSKVVLFLGRITFQKGPDYFVEAAARVVPFVPDVTFVMAGSGDMLPRLIDRVAELGIAKNFVFTGFLKGQDVERVFAMADLYVMPSVSEPFGITPLEAMSYDVPVIISKQSGVAEVLNSALKVDFWDVDKLAYLIIGALKYPEICQDVLTMAREEVRRLHWDSAADKILAIFGETIAKSA